MAKTGGLGWQLWMDGFEVGNDVQSIGRCGGGPAPSDKTGLDKLAIERIGLLRDGGLDITAFWNPSKVTNDSMHQVVRGLTFADRVLSLATGATIGDPMACIVAKQVNYDGTRDASGDLMWQVQSVPNGFGLEWTDLLTAGKRTDTAATNGASFDGLASSAFGLQAWLHVLAITGTSVTVALQESNDNGAGDPWANVANGVFTAATVRGSQRIQTPRTQTVKRWLRVATTGTFTNAVFVVGVNRNQVLTNF